MDANYPERLWKYREWDEKGYARNLIVKGDLYFATPAELNDPFEFYYQERLPKTDEDADKFVRELCASKFPGDSISARRERYTTMLAELQAFRRLFPSGIMPTLTEFYAGVYCASNRCDSILMWSHYADHHRGICVGLRLDRLLPQRFRPVEYSDRIPILDISDYIPNDNYETFVKLGLCKSDGWKYEEEWRTVMDRGVRSFSGCVDRVILGARVTPDTRQAVLDAVNEAPQAIEVFEAHLSPTRFKVGMKPVKDKPRRPKPWRHRK